MIVMQAITERIPTTTAMLPKSYSSFSSGIKVNLVACLPYFLILPAKDINTYSFKDFLSEFFTLKKTCSRLGFTEEGPKNQGEPK